MLSTILGWILIVLGIISYVLALIALVRSLLPQKAEKVTRSFNNQDFEPVCDLLDKLVSALESFSRLSIPVQWAILGLLNIGVGAYLITSQPF